MICDKNVTPPSCKEGCSDIHKCQSGYICCNGKCLKGECCSSEDCTRPGYPLCKEINDEMKCVDVCDPSSKKKINSSDNKFRCCKQNDDNYRCVIARCCTNEDCKDPQKPYCETALETPDCVNRCGPSTGDLKCGEGFICCYVLNDYMCFSGNCCIDSDCTNDMKCIGHHCMEDNCISEPSICKTEEKCCQDGPMEGVCFTGECCSDTTCQNSNAGHKCLISTYKCGCMVNSDCNSGYVCVNGVCKTGNCINDADCKDLTYPVCVDNKCSKCTQDIQCKNASKGDICCSGECKKGECCVSISPSMLDCETYITRPICKDGLCSPCLNSEECINQNLGNKCCTRGSFAGDCYDGQCCSSFDCLESGNVQKPICHIGDRNCYPCQSDNECQLEFGNNQLKCCSIKSSAILGSCYSGECCDDTQCSTISGRPFCDPSTHNCVQCLNNYNCPLHSICCNNQCVRGDCCKDKDCMNAGTGNFCYQYHCRQRCPNLTDCANSEMNECCTNITNYPFPFCVYDGGKCCTGDSDCYALDKCCYGICIPKTVVCY